MRFTYHSRILSPLCGICFFLPFWLLKFDSFFLENLWTPLLNFLIFVKTGADISLYYFRRYAEVSVAWLLSEYKGWPWEFNQIYVNLNLIFELLYFRLRLWVGLTLQLCGRQCECQEGLASWTELWNACQLWYLKRLPHDKIMWLGDRWMNEYGALIEWQWQWQGRKEAFEWSLVPHITQRPGIKTGRQLTSWAMAGPQTACRSVLEDIVCSS